MALFKSDKDKKKEFLKKGIEYENSNDNEKAIKEFEKILKLIPKDEDALFNLGFIYSDMKKYKEAYEHFKKLINSNPKHVEAFNNLGLLFARQGKFPDSLFVYEKGIENNPSSAVLFNNMGNVYYEMGKFEEALKNFKKAGDLDPVFKERLYHLGIDTKGGKEDDAIKKLEDSAKNNMNKAKTSHDLGVAYMEKHMYDKAITAFNQTLSIDPNYLSAYDNLGGCYQHKEDYAMAIKAFEKALILNPKSAKTYNTIGLLYDKLDKPDIAVKAYKKAVQLDPTYANSHYMLGQLYQNRGIIDKSVAEFTKHIRIHEHGSMVDECMQRIADMKKMTLEQIQELFKGYISEAPKPKAETPKMSEEKNAGDYLKNMKDKLKMNRSSVQAPLPPTEAPPAVEPLPQQEPTTPEQPVTKVASAADYMKIMKEKLKRKQAGLPDLPSASAEATADKPVAPPVAPPIAPSVSAETIVDNEVAKHKPKAIELPELGNVSKETLPEFTIEPELQAISLDAPNIEFSPTLQSEQPIEALEPNAEEDVIDYDTTKSSPEQFHPEAYRETIIKPVDSEAPLPTDTMPEFHKQPVEPPPVEEKKDSDTGSDDEGGPSLIKRGFF